jgi:hypothetical protein
MEWQVKMNAKMKNVPWKLSFMGLLFLFTILMVLPVHAYAQRKGTLQPKTTPSESKKQTLSQPKKKVTPKRPIVPEGKQADITIFATGNVLGYIEPCG